MNAKGIDYYLHVQALDTSTPSGRAMFQMLGVFSEFERAMISERVKTLLARVKASGKTLGRRSLNIKTVERVERALRSGQFIKATARAIGIGVGSVNPIKSKMMGIAHPRQLEDNLNQQNGGLNCSM